MSNTELTANEAMESITGFDEIAIEQSMGYDLYTDDESPKHRPVLSIRCLVFVLERRKGLKDAEARQVAMGMSVAQVNDYFAAAPDEIDPEAPETEPGKDGSTDVSEPESSPSSV